MAFSQKNRIKIANHIIARETFVHASMSATWVTSEYGLSNVGQLNYHPETLAEVNNLLKDRDLYVIYSYNTPIAYAWDRTIHILDHHYSVTTAHHQTIVKLADHYALNY